MDQGSTQIYSGNKAALVNILRKQGTGPNFGGSECGNLWIYLFHPFQLLSFDKATKIVLLEIYANKKTDKEGI